jgi:hypothetical protein
VIDSLFARLDAVVADGWDTIRRGSYFRHMLDHGPTPDLYRRTMVEIYHYTRFNSVNQALAVYRVAPERTQLLGYCYRHAGEELGHERMVIRDLESAGLLTSGLLDAPPLAPTQALIGYLYHVALNVGAVARLGYSYWAESAYDHFGDVLGRMKRDLSLQDRQMSFFIAHQSIDAKHAAEVKEAIAEHVQTEQEAVQVIEVARTTLYLTGAILEGVLAAHAGSQRAGGTTAHDRAILAVQ